ncbi:hypothetical protein MKEN_00023700 [Mycena kentingensis (nom. inval.)]|nr:hypothetical protein MKEN_00023700 [Mycena kentingensis (nom. inval.)]
MATPPQIFGPKKRQYAPDQFQAYTGVDALQNDMEGLSIGAATSFQDAPMHPPLTQQHVDLMTYPPDPRDLGLPTDTVHLPSGVGDLLFPDASLTQRADWYQQPTLAVVPNSDTVLKQVKLPLGLVISPHRTIPEGEEPPPLVHGGIIARCRQCLAYINPYVRFVEYSTRWQCSLCNTLNSVPIEYGWSRVVSGDDPHAQHRSRAELTHSVVDFVATTDYMRNPPQAPAFVFLLDVSEAAVQSGTLATAARAIADTLDNIPNAQHRTRVAVICYDTALHFFKITSENFEMMVVPDISEAYLPTEYSDLLVNLLDTRAGIDALLERLPELFAGTRPAGSATGSALDAARVLLASARGGKIVLIASSPPNAGRGALVPDSSSKSATPQEDKDPASFYHELAISCVNFCVSVDMFLCPASRNYMGLSTLSLLPHYSGGLTFYYPDPNPSVSHPKLRAELSRALSAPSFLEAELRVRCSRGLALKSGGMDGNFFLQGSDRAVLPSVPPDQGYTVELKIEQLLDPHLGVVILQTALLHTTASGERAIRVITSALPVVGTAAEVFARADARVVAAMWARQAVARSVVRSVEEQREALLLRAVGDLCRAYAAVHGTQATELQLRLPSQLRMLPVLVLGVFKKIAAQVQLNTEQALDLRAYTRTFLTSASMDDLIRFVYPTVYGLHNLPDSDTLPPPLPLTSSWWEAHGLYLVDPGDGQHIYLWVGRQAVPQLIQDVFGSDAHDYATLRTGPVDIPILQTHISHTTRELITQIRSRPETKYQPTLYVVKDESISSMGRAELAAVQYLRVDVLQALIHDRLDDLRPSYRQFLVKVHERVR